MTGASDFASLAGDASEKPPDEPCWPDGKGEFEPVVYERLNDIGRWLEANGEAIYNTVPVEPFQEGRIAYTAKGGHTVFVIYLFDEDEKELPSELAIKTTLKGDLRVSLPTLRQELSSKPSADGIKVFVPASLRSRLAGQPALAIRIEN